MPEKLVLHAVIIDKKVGLEKAKKIASDIIKNPKKTYYREDSQSYRFRNEAKTKFKQDSFKSKVINKDVTLVFGHLL
jgi:hypothetical protein